MERISKLRGAASLIAGRVLALVLLLVHFLLIVIGLSGQSLKPGFIEHPGHPVHSASKANEVKKIYTSQIGVREKRVNRGVDVEKYLRYVNLPAGNPWCAAFVCWVYGQAGVGNPRSGWSPDLFGADRVIWGRKLTMDSGQWTMGIVGERGSVLRPPKSSVGGKGESGAAKIGAAGRCAYPPLAGVGGGLKYTSPRTADIFGLYFPEKHRIAHVGFIDEWNDPWVLTVEGNTNLLGSSEGDGVYRKRRLVRSIYKVARYVN